MRKTKGIDSSMLSNSPVSGNGELCRIGAADLAEAYRRRDLSPVEVAAAAMDRAEEINPQLNAFTLIDREGALAAATASERRWRDGEPLSPADGIPTTLKDIVWVDGWSVRYGSSTTSNQKFDQDAPSVARLRRAGAVFIGQTTTPEFGWKAVTDSRLFGVTRNPWNPEKTPGGSSGGAAVAAATGAGVFHLGTDGGGSIRIPASFCGIVGLKPTFGRVPAYPASPFGTVAHLGPMARTVADTAAMLKAMSGRDVQDWAQGPGKLPPLGSQDIDLRGLRIGYWAEPPVGLLDASVKSVVDARVAVLKSAGAGVETVNLPGEDLPDLFRHHWFSGAAARLAQIPQDVHDVIDPGLVDVAEQGARLDARSLVAAQLRRAEFGAAMDKLLESFDFLVSPGTAIPAFDAGVEFPAGSGFRRWTDWAGFSFPINLSQQPACVIPCGMTADGLPIGFQIVGARGADARVLSAAQRLEALFSE